MVVGHFVSGGLWEWMAVGSGLLGRFNGWWWEWVAVVAGGDSGLWLLLVVAVASSGSGLLWQHVWWCMRERWREG